MFSKRNLIVIIILIILTTIGYLAGTHIYGGGSADRGPEEKKASEQAQLSELRRKVKANALMRALPQDLEYCFYVSIQTDAILREISYPIGWFPEDKKMLKEVSRDCIKDLKELKKGMKREWESESTVKIAASLIDKSEKAITGIDKKSSATMSREGGAVAKKREELLDALAGILDKYLENVKYEVVVSQAEAECFKDDGDRKNYLKALEYIDKYDFAAAYKTLKELDKRMLSDQARAIVTVRTADCIYNDFAPDKEDKEKLKIATIIVLERVAAGDTYFPGISTAFLKWRCVHQQFINGPSNLTDIPNYYFNKVRHKTIKTVKDHIEKNPDDKFARYEYGVLLLTENIKRGQMGNDSSHYFFEYYRRDLRGDVGL